MNIRKSILSLAVVCLLLAATAPVVPLAQANTALLPLECVTAIDEGWGTSGWSTVCLWRLEMDGFSCIEDFFN